MSFVGEPRKRPCSQMISGDILSFGKVTVRGSWSCISFTHVARPSRRGGMGVRILCACGRVGPLWGPWAWDAMGAGEAQAIHATPCARHELGRRVLRTV